MLSSKQRAFLRKMAHDLSPLLTIGKEGSGPNIARQLEDILPLHELVKVSILKSCDEDPREVAHALAEQVGAEVVQVVGHRFVLYRYSLKLAEKGKAIILPV